MIAEDLFAESIGEFVRLIPTRTRDGEGGTTTVWNEGETFTAAVATVESSMSTIADALTSRANCQIWTRKDVVLNPLDVVKRVKDGQIFRVLALNEDKQTPDSALMNARCANAEKWALPVGSTGIDSTETDGTETGGKEAGALD